MTGLRFACCGAGFDEDSSWMSRRIICPDTAQYQCIYKLEKTTLRVQRPEIISTCVWSRQFSPAYGREISHCNKSTSNEKHANSKSNGQIGAGSGDLIGPGRSCHSLRKIVRGSSRSRCKIAGKHQQQQQKPKPYSRR